MNELKKWLPELLVDTIVALVATLFTYILGLDKTWSEASKTFFIAFIVMFLLGIYNKRRNKKRE